MQVVSTGLAPLRTGGFFTGMRSRLEEKKTIDVDVTTMEAYSTAQFTLLNGSATGTDFTDRIGRKIIMKSLYLRCSLEPADNSNLANSTVRVFVVYDMQTNGAIPAITDILKSAHPLAQLNLNNRDRFKILYDKLWTPGAVSNTATQSFAYGPLVTSFKKWKKLNLETIYGGTTAAVASIQTGSLYLVTLGTLGTGNGDILGFSSRVRFIDA